MSTRRAIPILAGVLALLVACGAPEHTSRRETSTMRDAENGPAEKVVRTDAEWRELLSPEEYRVTRQAGTEAPFTGRYWNTKAPGTYVCVGCGQVLFRSTEKFESGCGWPSFFDDAVDGHVVKRIDRSLGMVREEILCSRCGAHLGHVFDDGPPPTGQRYCVNSAALKLIPEESEGG